MKITEKEVRYIAGLANLNLSDDDVTKYVGDMEKILGYVEKLSELDTSDVEPMTQVLFDADETGTLRDDTLGESYTQQKALQSAPVAGAGHFKIPLVISR